MVRQRKIQHCQLQVAALSSTDLERLVRTGGDENLITGFSKQPHQELANRRLIVDERRGMRATADKTATRPASPFAALVPGLSRQAAVKPGTRWERRIK